MFRVLTPIIRGSYDCNYSSWYWLTGSNTFHSRCWVGTDLCVSYVRYTYRTVHMNQCQHKSTPETCRAAYRNVMNWISCILLDSYWIRLTMYGPMYIKFPRNVCGIQKYHNFITFLEINSCNSREIYQPVSIVYITGICIYYNKVRNLLSAWTLTILILSWFPSVSADTIHGSTSSTINCFIPKT